MLHYGHQVVASFDCRPFGAEQVVYGGFELWGRTKTIKLWAGATMIWEMLKRSVKLRGTAELSDNSLWVHHYERPLSHFTWSFDLLLM